MNYFLASPTVHKVFGNFFQKAFFSEYFELDDLYHAIVILIHWSVLMWWQNRFFNSTTPVLSETTVMSTKMIRWDPVPEVQNSWQPQSKSSVFHGLSWSKVRLIQWSLSSIANATQSELGFLRKNAHQWRCWHLK